MFPADIVDRLDAAQRSLDEVSTTIAADQSIADPAALAHKVGLAEAHINDALTAIADAQKSAVSCPDVAGDLAWAERDLRHALRSLGNIRAALAALREMPP